MRRHGPQALLIAAIALAPLAAPEYWISLGAYIGLYALVTLGICVLVLGVNNMATLIAKCCKPVPPDPIVGFVTRARGITVHRQDCPNVNGLAPDQRERLMPADWGKNAGEAGFAADLEVVAA